MNEYWPNDSCVCISQWKSSRRQIMENSFDRSLELELAQAFYCTLYSAVAAVLYLSQKKDDHLCSHSARKSEIPALYLCTAPASRKQLDGVPILAHSQ